MSYLSFVQRTFDWGGGNIFVWRGRCRAVFFNLFAAAEPCATFCVARGTLCNCETVVLLHPHRTVVANFIPGRDRVYGGTGRTCPPQLLDSGDIIYFVLPNML